MLNLYVLVHKEVRRQLLYFNIQIIFLYVLHTHFPCSVKNPMLVHKCVDKINKIMEILKLRILKNTNF